MVGYNFNPRSREGSDSKQSIYEQLISISIHAPAKGATFKHNSTNIRVIFQSTLPRRERRWIFIYYFLHIHFNPRSREGSDVLFYLYSPFRIISIHAPAKGATNSSKSGWSQAIISIHAPAKGATAILSNFISYIFQFSLIFTNIFLLIFYF